MLGDNDGAAAPPGLARIPPRDIVPMTARRQKERLAPCIEGTLVRVKCIGIDHHGWGHEWVQGTGVVQQINRERTAAVLVMTLPNGSVRWTIPHDPLECNPLLVDFSYSDRGRQLPVLLDGGGRVDAYNADALYDLIKTNRIPYEQWSVTLTRETGIQLVHDPAAGAYHVGNLEAPLTAETLQNLRGAIRSLRLWTHESPGDDTSKADLVELLQRNLDKWHTIRLRHASCRGPLHGRHQGTYV
jgi:hypothetical protein